ncbi:MAG: phosphoenolpyruvate carboxylase [Pseudohongiellaceae bacterium]
MPETLGKTFEQSIALNYQLYNGLFLTLPLDAVEQTGLLLPLLEADCQEGLEQGRDPVDIIQGFLKTHKPDFTEQEQTAFLFKVIQYVERQVVLVDALEDAAYSKMHQSEKLDALQQLLQRTSADNSIAGLAKLLTRFVVRVTLTAHPTQFYPGPVLAIIGDLTRAISRANTPRIRELLLQLGHTPFFRKEKPSPYDEAVLLSWYLGNIFYPVMGRMMDKLAPKFPEALAQNPQLMKIGFWPGGDRDGNPFVTVEITRRVAAKLRYSIANCYHQHVRELKRRLTFPGIYERLGTLEKQLHGELSDIQPRYTLTAEGILETLDEIESRLVERHQGLFLGELHSFRNRVRLFGFHFASLDIRQDSTIIKRTLDDAFNLNPELSLPSGLSEDEETASLMRITGNINIEAASEPVLQDTLKSFSVVREIQAQNGEQGCHRYIISNCHGPVDMARAYALFRLCGWHDIPLTIDIVPLFESIHDLKHAGDYMARMYANPDYSRHLQNRGGRQTVMLGFSDGTKDGGYLMANWAIFRAKEDITAASREAGIEVAFFDGRGGPPARGGGNTYLFYAHLGKKIEGNQVQMTVQGQTISSHFGIKQAAHHNLSQLLAAGLENKLYDHSSRELNTEQRELIQSLADISYRKYTDFKQHPLFLPYLEQMSTLKYYNMANIGSRPARRGNASELRFEDLRAIPFVGAWGQLKQNVPGYFGLGTALKEQENAGRWQGCTRLYRESGFIRALIVNSMQNISKSNFALTRYMSRDPVFGEFWNLIHDEFELTREMVMKISGQKLLLEDNPRTRLSIELREKVVLPLLVIQQYGLMQIHSLRDTDEDARMEVYEKMVVRSLYGNINASRNSA